MITRKENASSAAQPGTSGAIPKRARLVPLGESEKENEAAEIHQGSGADSSSPRSSMTQAISQNPDDGSPNVISTSISETEGGNSQEISDDSQDLLMPIPRHLSFDEFERANQPAEIQQVNDANLTSQEYDAGFDHHSNLGSIQSIPLSTQNTPTPGTHRAINTEIVDNPVSLTVPMPRNRRMRRSVEAAHQPNPPVQSQSIGRPGTPLPHGIETDIHGRFFEIGRTNGG